MFIHKIKIKLIVVYKNNLLIVSKFLKSKQKLCSHKMDIKNLKYLKNTCIKNFSQKQNKKFINIVRIFTVK